VVARARLGGQWSGKSEASFVSDAPLLIRITEIMYHPKDASAGSIYDADDFEFIELQNVGPGPLSLLGVRFTQGIDFDFSGGAVTDLGAGEYVVVVKNRSAFSTRYGLGGLLIAGEYQGNLENDGETLILTDGRGQNILAFRYDDRWYPVTDGDGYSLVMRDPQGDPSGWGDQGRWTPSAEINGSPGAGESTPPGGFQVPGDANQNGSVDLSDAVAILLDLFLGSGRALPCGGNSISEGGNLTLLDLNGDKGADVSDAVYVLAYLFRQGPPPVLGTSCMRLTDCPDACSR